MSDAQLEALRRLMNAQRSYLLAAQINHALPEALEKMWAITTILDQGLDLELDTANQIQKDDGEVAELNRLFGL